MSKKRRFSILNRKKSKEKQGENENQETETVKYKSKKSGVLGIVGGILNRGNNNNSLPNKGKGVRIHELEPKVIEEINRQVTSSFGEYGNIERYQEEIDLVISLMRRLYTKKDRVKDCVAIAEYLHYDKERIDNFIENFEKLENDPYFSVFAINSNLKYLLPLYAQLDEVSEIQSDSFELSNEEINKIIEVAIRDKIDIIKSYKMYMYIKYAEMRNERYKSEDLIKDTALEIISELINMADEFKCSLAEVWDVFGTNGDIEQRIEKKKGFSLDDISEDLHKKAEIYFSNDPITIAVNSSKRIGDEKAGLDENNILEEGKVSEYIDRIKILSFREYGNASGRKTRLGLTRIGVDEFKSAYRNWLHENNIDPAKVDIRKAYQFYNQNGQTNNSLNEYHAKYEELKKTRPEKAKEVLINKTKKPATKAKQTATSAASKAKRTAYGAYKKATANKYTKFGTFAAATVTTIIVFNGGKAVRNIIVDANNAKAQKTESTIKMGATTIPGTIEPGFFESLYNRESKEIPVNTTAIIYPNGNVELVLEDGIKQINSTRAANFGIVNDENNRESYIRMGKTYNTEISLMNEDGEIINEYGYTLDSDGNIRDKEGNIVDNNGEEFVPDVLLPQSEVIILAEARKEDGLNIIHVIETKTGKEGYVYVGDIEEKEIDVQEYEVGGGNQTYYLMHAEGGVPVRETPYTSPDYNKNVKGYLGFGKQKDYLVVEDEENKDFYHLVMYGKDESAYVYKGDVETTYIVQSNGLQKIEQEEEIDPYAENQNYEISEGKFAVGYTTKPQTIEEGWIFLSKTEIPAHSYVIKTSKTTQVITKEGRIITISKNNEEENSDIENFEIKYLKTGIISTPNRQGALVLDKDGIQKHDKKGKGLKFQERATVIISPTEKNGENYEVNDDQGNAGYTKFVTDQNPYEYNMDKSKIIQVSGNCPILKSPYYDSNYKENLLTDKKGNPVPLPNGELYIAKFDKETGYYKLIDKKFLRTYYIPSEYVSKVLTVTEEEVIVEDKEEQEIGHQANGEEPEK